MDFEKTVAANPLSILPLADAKYWLNVDNLNDVATNANVTVALASAVARIEKETNRAIGLQTWICKFDSFPAVSDANPAGALELPFPPLKAVSSVQYLKTDGTLTTLDSSKYRVLRSTRERGRIQPAYGESWPATLPVEQAVLVEIVCGYVVGAASPETEMEADLLMAVRIALSDAFDNRSGSKQSKEAEETIKRYCGPFVSDRYGYHR